MPHFAYEEWTDREIDLVFIAGSIPEAERVSEALENGGVEFATRLEEYATIFWSVRKGVGFYVPEERAAAVRVLLAQHGFEKGIVESAEGPGGGGTRES